MEDAICQRAEERERNKGGNDCRKVERREGKVLKRRLIMTTVYGMAHFLFELRSMNRKLGCYVLMFKPARARKCAVPQIL